MSTQTELLEMLMPLQVPPCVRVSVPICVPPTNISSTIEFAEAAGTVASVAAMTDAKIETLSPLSRTSLPPRGRNTNLELIEASSGK